MLFGQSSYISEPAPGNNEPPWHNPNRPSSFNSPNDSGYSELQYLRKKRDKNPVQNPLNKHTKSYFSDIFQDELANFNKCIKNEGLNELAQIRTKCEISKSLSDAAFILDGKNITAFDLLNKYTKYEKIKIVQPIYPKNMLQFGETGFVIVEFDITQDGKVINTKAIDGRCGNLSNPYTQLEPCSFFNRAAIAALVKSQYSPAKFNNKAIYTEGAKHRFTFSLRPEYLEVENNVKQAYRAVIKKIRTKDFDGAIALAEENIKYDEIFIFELARAYHFKAQYTKTTSLLFEFIEESKKNKEQYPEEILFSSLIILIESLYFVDDYKNIISLENSISQALKQKSKYRENLAMTSLYLGASFVNSGDLNKGMFYLGLARKYSASDNQLESVDRVINQVANYL